MAGAERTMRFAEGSPFPPIAEYAFLSDRQVQLLSFASPLQLYAEEIDVVTGRHLGNFPQAFTHLALINAVVHLIQAELRQQRGFSMAHQIVT